MSSHELISSDSAQSSNKMSFSRRRVLQLMAASGAGAIYGAFPGMAMSSMATSSMDQGYGPDPDLFNPTVTWGKKLTEKQLTALTILGDIIIPEDQHSPKASDLDIADFVNEWLSAPYPQQQQDRVTVLDGLAWLDQQAQAQEGKPFIACTATSQAALFDRLAAAVESGTADEDQTQFFDRIVFLFVGGFYTTDEGMADIGYVGNVPLAKFEGPPPEVRRRLGLAEK